MRITFVTCKFGNVERNSHCDVLHITPIRVARLFLDCNGDFAIKAMAFNAKKCYLMNIARTRNHLTHNYSLNNHILQTVTREKYLGITISNDLNWSTHINTITNKCNSKLGFLRRNLSRCPQKLKETAYLSQALP